MGNIAPVHFIGNNNNDREMYQHLEERQRQHGGNNINNENDSIIHRPLRPHTHTPTHPHQLALPLRSHAQHNAQELLSNIEVDLNRSSSEHDGPGFISLDVEEPLPFPVSFSHHLRHPRHHQHVDEDRKRSRRSYCSSLNHLGLIENQIGWGYALPEDAFIHCFSFLEIRDLATVACVNGSWRDACYTPSLWRSLDLSRIFAKGQFAFLLALFGVVLPCRLCILFDLCVHDCAGIRGRRKW
jgi:hypothetical protein